MALTEEDVEYQLFEACENGDDKTLKQLLSESDYAVELLQDTHVPDRGKAIGERTIFAACVKGHLSTVKFLLDEGVNVNVNTDQGTPIYAAAKIGELKIVHVLIDWGAEFRHMRGGFSPLYAASLYGHLEVLKFLVRRTGISVLQLESPQFLMNACANGHVEVVKWLLETTNFNLNKTLKGKDVLKDDKDSLLHIACNQNQLEVAEFLVTQGAIITKGVVARFPTIVQGILERQIAEYKPAASAKGKAPVQFQANWSGMSLADFPGDVFMSFDKLAKVDLKRNMLESVPESLFTLVNLQVLDLSHNALGELTSEECVWRCDRLRELDVSHCQLSTLSPSVFELRQLQTLNAGFNLLSVLPGDNSTASRITTWNCEQLQRLDLSHNHIRSLPDCFQNLKKLKQLKVSYNILSELPLSLCWGSIGLVNLDASHNQLQDLPFGAPNYWQLSMEHLYLAHNSIEFIAPNITELTRLNVLNLSHNKIVSLPATSAWTCDRLTRLDLGHNELPVISHRAMVDQHFPRLAPEGHSRKGAGGGGGGGLLQKIFTKKGAANAITDAPTGDRAGETAECELPYEKWGKCLQVLNLNNNKLLWLPDYIGSLHSLTKLDLSSNPSLETLPLSMGFLKNCWELNLHGLNLSGIPPHLRPGDRRGNTRQLLAFLRAQKRQSKVYNRMKLMVVGLQGRGKTTLLSVLRDRTSSLPENISTVGVVVNKWECNLQTRGANKKDPVQTVHFSTWDLAGQEVYYATHQCFLSRNTLYLAVWNMEGGEKEIKALRPWLLNIRARAPHSPVIIVGTHADRLPQGRAADLKAKYRRRIEELYLQPGGGYPEVSKIMEVSATTKEGIPQLHDTIVEVALNARDPDTKDKIIGQQVPASYIGLHRVIEEEVAKRRLESTPPVLTQEQFTKLTDKIPENDILDDEDLALAAQFLHDNGVLLHYNDHLRGLNNLYFIDPAWLCDMLAEVITVPEKNAFARNGILADANVAFLFKDTRKFPPQYLKQYLQLLERFEIALSLGDGTRLIPSMLSVSPPAYNFSKPLPQEPEELKEGSIGPPVCVKRRYLMVYIPSGFWSRLITRIMINFSRTGLLNDRKALAHDTLYWRRGIYITYSTGKFLVQALDSVKINRSFDKSTAMVGDGVPEAGPRELQGLEFTVWSTSEDYSIVGYIVDQIESLIDEWFPGLNDVDHYGQSLIERDAIWVVPAHLRQNKARSPHTQGSPVLPSQEDETVDFPLEECALQARSSRSIFSSDYNTDIPLEHLVPELLLTDLPAELSMDVAQLEYKPDDYSTLMGVGGAGAVYEGKYKGEPVAIKRFLTTTEAERVYEIVEYGKPRETTPIKISAEEALQLFRELRQEVTVLAFLDSPYVVNLRGVCLNPLFMATELAPGGSLFGVLSKKREEVIAQQGQRAVSQIPKMPGGVLGHEWTTELSVQVAIALSYLHDQHIVYRDLKADNVLVWKLDRSQTVNVKLADYGISRFANPGGVKGDQGTPGYMAPEALKKRGEDQAFDEKVDIFAFAMLLYELTTGVRPFDEIENVSDINRMVIRGERPRVLEYNAEPTFPSLTELMYDCWKQAAADRPDAKQVIGRLSEPGFLCRKHTITTTTNQQPLHKIQQTYSLPVPEGHANLDCSYVWTWSKANRERNYSILNAERGIFMAGEKTCEGGRVYCMTATGEVEKRLWTGTADHEIQVFEQRNLGESQLLWTYMLKRGDAVLALTTEVVKGRVTRVFAALGNGYVWVFSRESIVGLVPDRVGSAVKRTDAITLRVADPQFQGEAEEWLHPLILQVSESKVPPNCLEIINGNRLWCGCGNTIVVFDIERMEKVKEFRVFKNRFYLVKQLVAYKDRVWVRGRQIASVKEYDATTYQEICQFNCEEIDPTGKIIMEAASVEEDPKDDDLPFPEPGFPLDAADLPQPANGHVPQFDVESEPTRLRHGPQPYSQVAPLTSLRNRRRRLHSIIISKADLKTKHHGGTRVTSLHLVKDCLWVGRGMGDVLVVNISGRENHGRVLARLALDDTESYGKKSNHTLVLVNNQYVVGAQYLEPVFYKVGGVGRSESQPRQQITIWEAWNKARISHFNQRMKAMLEKGGVSFQGKN